jgi:glycosyltransferase involved in cell wall biosynthesis
MLMSVTGISMFLSLTNIEVRSLHLGIDAVNIRQGGGLTHLSQLLQAADPMTVGFNRVTVWSNKATADVLPNRPWLIKRVAPWMGASLPWRMLGHQFQLGREMSSMGCDVLFSPGGVLPRVSNIPMVTMSQNMLPFEPTEAVRFGLLSLMRLKMRMLRYSQRRSFQNADGLIFLTNYAEQAVSLALGGLGCSAALIPHGIETRFLQAPRPQRRVEDCSGAQPFRVLYVSILMPYKHQIEVAKAAVFLRERGIPIEIQFVGALWGRYGKEFAKLCRSLDPEKRFLKWSGHVSFEYLHNFYSNADAFVFASSCENLPNILIEAMASGLPIACANRGPMPEVLGAAGIYFDPESPSEIANALQTIFSNSTLRTRLAQEAWEKAQDYSWARCAQETLLFISQVAQRHKREN